MLDEHLCAEIAKHWKGRVYQEWSREKYRLMHFEKVAPVFRDLRVVDMGCNAGLHAVQVCQYAASYLGIERKREYHLQALETRKFIEHPNCTFVRANAVEYVMSRRPDFDALLLSFIVYHFSDSEIADLRDQILPNVPLVVVYNRVDRPTVKNSYDLHLHEKMLAFLKGCGYETEFNWGRKALFYSVIGRRKETT